MVTIRQMTKEECQHDVHGDIGPEGSHHPKENLPKKEEMSRFSEMEKGLIEVTKKKRPAASNRVVMIQPSSSQSAVQKKPRATVATVMKRPSKRQ